MFVSDSNFRRIPVWSRFHEQHTGSKSKKIITKIVLEGVFHVSLLANGQPRECAYKIKIKNCVLIYIHQALRTWGQRNPSQVYQDMEIYNYIYLYILIKRLYYSIYTLFNKLSREQEAKFEALLHITSQIIHFLFKRKEGEGGKKILWKE